MRRFEPVDQRVGGDLERRAAPDVLAARVPDAPAGASPSQAAILALQRTAGNQAVQRLLRSSAGRSLLQRKTVNVSGGVFEDLIYEADNELNVGQKKTGAKMKLEFRPRDDLPAERVSLVQTVKRDVKVGGKALEQETSLMSLRGDVEHEPVIDAELVGEVETTRTVPELDAAIARLQQLNTGRGTPVFPDLAETLTKARAITQSGEYAAPETRKTRGSVLRVYLQRLRTKVTASTLPAAAPMKQALDDATEALKRVSVKTHPLVNLDPRYTEKRMRPTDPFAQKPGEAHVPEHHGHSATKRGGTWLPAQLRDWPGPTADLQTPVTGGMEFEVAAMAEGTGSSAGSFVGSVRWGFKVSPPNTSRLDPRELELKERGTASPAFFGAAERWNKMKVPSGTGVDTPMQLPVHQAPRGGQPSSAPTTQPSRGGAQPTQAPTQPAKPQSPAKQQAPTQTGKAEVRSSPAKPPSVDVDAIDKRWDKVMDFLPVSKAAEKQFGPSYGVWLERRSDPAVAEWAVNYLDWLTASLLGDARQLDARWREISGVLEDLTNTQEFVKLRYDVRARYKTWSAQYEAAKQGSLPAATVFFDEPTALLDDIERTWKGKPAAAWSKGVKALNVRKGFWWT